MAYRTKEELDAQYKGVHILVFDKSHPDHGKKCVFVEMVRKRFQKRYLMKVKLLLEDRTLELPASAVFIITAEIPLPRAKDN